MGEKKLKKGFTTGTSAAAAAGAALELLLSGRKKEAVSVRFLSGGTCTIPLHSLELLDDTSARASVIKDAGDDPDVTHRAEIGAVVTLEPDPGIRIMGGLGVGQVTKPGLEITPGNPAINPGPQKMIMETMDVVFAKYPTEKMPGARVEVFVPKGEELAKKTLNARLGILGGISILGTTGIVTPMSHDAYIASIRSSVSVAAAQGCDTLVFTTGRRSERFAMELFPGTPKEAFVQTGDFFKASLDAAWETDSICRVIITVFFGKAVKMAMGFPHTHAAKSELTLKRLSEWAVEITRDRELALAIKNSNTARHAFSLIHPRYPGLISRVGEKIMESAAGFSHGRLSIQAVIFDFEGRPVFDASSTI